MIIRSKMKICCRMDILFYLHVHWHSRLNRIFGNACKLFILSFDAIANLSHHNSFRFISTKIIVCRFGTNQSLFVFHRIKIKKGLMDTLPFEVNYKCKRCALVCRDILGYFEHIAYCALIENLSSSEYPAVYFVCNLSEKNNEYFFN